MLHDFISLHRDEILARCLIALKDQCPNRQDHELLEGISRFVDELVRALARDAGISENRNDDAEHGDATARQHGATRRNQGFDLSRVVHDYGLVCETVTEMASEHDETFNPREYQRLNHSIDEA